MNGMEKLQCLTHLIGLQRADEVQDDIRMPFDEFRPFCGSFLNPVFPEMNVSLVEYIIDSPDGLELGNRQEKSTARGLARSELRVPNALVYFRE